MPIQPEFLARLDPVDDYWIVVRPDFDPENPEGLIYNFRRNRMVGIESDALASEVVRYLLNLGSKIVPVQNYRSWLHSNFNSRPSLSKKSDSDIAQR